MSRSEILAFRFHTGSCKYVSDGEVPNAYSNFKFFKAFYPYWIFWVLLLLLLLSRFSRVQLCATPWRQPTRLPRPWDSPGRNTGVGCHLLLQCMKVKSESEVAQSCPTLATPWTAAFQAPPSMGFSRQEYWSGVPLLSLIYICYVLCTIFVSLT